MAFGALQNFSKCLELYHLGIFNHLGHNWDIFLEYLKPLNFHFIFEPRVPGISVFSWAWPYNFVSRHFWACEQWLPPILPVVVAWALVSQVKLWFRITGRAVQKYPTPWLVVEVLIYFRSFPRDSNVPPGLRIAYLGL